jgi:hypothetical protein
LIAEKCREFRVRTNTVENDTIDDITIYLESQMAGSENVNRTDMIKKMGIGLLTKYVDDMQTLFVTGNLPSALQPAKIYACHDVVTAAELRGSIIRLSES